MNKEEQKRLEAEKIMAMTNFKKFYPEYENASLAKVSGTEEWNDTLVKLSDLEKTNMDYACNLDNFREENDALISQMKELQDALSNALNEEQAIKKECSECKSQLDAYIRENAKLNKDLEKYKADNIKLKKAVTELTTQ